MQARKGWLQVGFETPSASEAKKCPQAALEAHWMTPTANLLSCDRPTHSPFEPEGPTGLAAVADQPILSFDNTTPSPPSIGSRT